MDNHIFKVVAVYGCEEELDSVICINLEKAIANARLWLKDKNCDSVEIYEEAPDYGLGIYTTIRMHKPITRED